MSQNEIGARVRATMTPGLTQRLLAEHVGMTTDAMSRSLNGDRAFTAIELAKIADLLDADLHWLIVGRTDPRRIRLVAHHEYDHTSGARSVPGRTDDESELRNVELAYRQAYPGEPEERRRFEPLPPSVDEVRKRLAPPFVREFADRVESALAVDVVRIPNLSTDYSFAIAGRHVIVLTSQANWFRSNWSLAHELGHLALGHHDVDDRAAQREVEANRFAAELLLPHDDLRQVDWQWIEPVDVARFLWDSGVSSDALLRRLDRLRLPVGSSVRDILGMTTQRILRRHGWALDGVPLGVAVDPVTARMNAAAARRFPLTLLSEHVRLVADGEISAGTLAWMLETSEEDLGVDPPAIPQMSTQSLADALGF